MQFLTADRATELILPRWPRHFLMNGARSGDILASTPVVRVHHFEAFRFSELLLGRQVNVWSPDENAHFNFAARKLGFVRLQFENERIGRLACHLVGTSSGLGDHYEITTSAEGADLLFVLFDRAADDRTNSTFPEPHNLRLAFGRFGYPNGVLYLFLGSERSCRR